LKKATELTEQFYEDLFDTLEANFRSILSPATRNAWARKLVQLNRMTLRIAVSNLCESEEKMPSLAKIIQVYRGVNPQSTSPHYLPTRDAQNVACLYDPEKEEHLYRAPDCPEGRNFLATLGEIAGKSPEEMAKILEELCASGEKR
jgi:hypothetical protein